MKKSDLLVLAECKKLIVKKVDRGIASRNKYIWSKDDERIIRVDKVQYHRHWYFARTPDMRDGSFYKITKADFYEFIKAGASNESDKE